MQRDIKFRAWNNVDKRMIEWSTLDLLFHTATINSKYYNVMQFTGLKDKNGVEIYEGDLLNIFFTSGDGEYIHDCVYRVQIGGLGDAQFSFVDLLWSCHAHNQYPSSTTLCSKYESLDYEYEADEIKLKVPDNWGENHLHGNRWKQNDKSFYFEVIGNIYENPELLGETK